MGFFGTIGRGLGGAVSGFAATGSPWGAAAGALGGFLTNGNGPEEQGSKGYNLRDWTPQEQAMNNQLMSNMQNYGQGYSAQDREGMIAKAQDAYFQPMAQQIGDQYTQATGTNRVANSRGGMLGSSASQSQQGRTDQLAAQNLANAYGTSMQMGEQSFFNRDANRMQNLTGNAGIYGQLAQQRLGESDQWSSGQMHDPNAFSNAMMGGFGNALSTPAGGENLSAGMSAIGNGIGDAAGWLGRTLRPQRQPSMQAQQNVGNYIFGL